MPGFVGEHAIRQEIRCPAVHIVGQEAATLVLKLDKLTLLVAQLRIVARHQRLKRLGPAGAAGIKMKQMQSLV